LFPSTNSTFSFHLRDSNGTIAHYTGAPVVLAPGHWTNLSLPLNPANWDSTINILNWNSITHVYVDVINASGPLPLNETVNIDDISFSTCSLASPTPTLMVSPSAPPTSTLTPTITSTPTATSTFSCSSFSFDN